MWQPLVHTVYVRAQSLLSNADVRSARDKVTEKEFQTAARFVAGKSYGEVDDKEHASVGEESQDMEGNDGDA